MFLFVSGVRHRQGRDITWDTWVDTIELRASRPNLFFFFFFFLRYFFPLFDIDISIVGLSEFYLPMYYIDSTLRIDASVPCASAIRIFLMFLY